MRNNILAILVAAVVAAVSYASAQSEPEWNANSPDDGYYVGNAIHFAKTYSLTGTWSSVTWAAKPFTAASIEIASTAGATNVFRLLRTRTTIYDGVTNTWTSILVAQGFTNTAAGTAIVEPARFAIIHGDILLFTNTVPGLNVTLNAWKR